MIPQKYPAHQAAAGAIEPKFWMTVLPPPGQATSLAALSSTIVLVKRHLHGLVWSRGSSLGAWRLRNNSTWSDNAGWDAIASTLQRDIKTLQSQLEIGQTYTNGELFDSVQ